MWERPREESTVRQKEAQMELGRRRLGPPKWVEVTICGDE